MFEEYLEVAFEAARAAGAIQLEGYGRSIRIATKSSAIDLITEIDQACEAEIARQVLQRYPGHRFKAEEGTEGGLESDYCWHVDPLDGTTNYAHHYPYFSVSIALEYQAEIVAGVVYDALHNEMFHAVAGGGAYLNGQAIRVSAVPRLGQALLCTGFPGDQAGNRQVLAAWEKISLNCHGIRRDGSAALDLCYVAAGRLDGFWERLNSWDMAAGALIVREAGGTVTNFNGGPFDLYQREIVASNGQIAAEMVAVLREMN